MKKLVLLFTGMLMGLTTVTAAEFKSANQSSDLDLTSRYRYAQPILFVERGVEFLIFADGSFDFNTDLNTAVPDNYYYRRASSRRSSAIRTFSAPGTTYHYGGRGVIVTHDNYGRVRRVGNVFINYDRKGRIKRAGSVYVNYRRGLLTEVGGLNILYNRRGNVIGTRGFVNYSNRGCGFCGITGCSVNHFDNHSQYDDYKDWDGNSDYFYYKKNGKTKKRKKLKKYKKQKNHKY